MEAEAIRTIMYLLLVLGGGLTVGLLAILFIIAIVTLGAWVAIAISSLKGRRAPAGAV